MSPPAPCLPLPRPTTRYCFEIALICALPLESDPCDALFDCHWDDDGPPLGKADGDPNAYSIGSIGRHNIVLVHMPSMGKISAAVATSHCRTSFPNIKLALVVGICGVVPFYGREREEIILGDVIISRAVIHHDFGQQLPDGFVRKETLLGLAAEAPSPTSGLLSKLKMRRHNEQLSLQTATNLCILQNKPKLSALYPGTTLDKLFEATYHHLSNRQPCEKAGCSSGRLVSRRRLGDAESHPRPAVHLGPIASGDMVIKSGEYRDTIAAKEGAIAFEMEGAGAWANFPCVIVKSACDYADSHKSKEWQRYAAATSAACMKAILDHWLPPLSRGELLRTIESFDNLRLSLNRCASDISKEDILALLYKASVQNESSRLKIESSDAKLKTNNAIISDTTGAFRQFLSGLLLLAWCLGPQAIVQRLDNRLNTNQLTLQNVIASDRIIASDLRTEEEIAREMVDRLQMAAYSIQERENASLPVQDEAQGESVASSQPPNSEGSQSSDVITPETLGVEMDQVGQLPISAELEVVRQEKDELVGHLHRLQDECKKLQETVNGLGAKILEIDAKAKEREEMMEEAERLRREHDNQNASASIWFWIMWLMSWVS